MLTRILPIVDVRGHLVLRILFARWLVIGLANYRQ